MIHLMIRDPEEYLRLLQRESSEREKLQKTITITVSSFFRDPLSFEMIGEMVLPEIFERKRAGGKETLRVWSAGCARGEEAYSLAILVSELSKKMRPSWQVHLFGTDIDEEALENARGGLYPREALLNTRLGRVDQYFSRCLLGYEILPEIREMVHFSFHDLTGQTAAPQESVFGTFDLVLCRNVLIYFLKDEQEKIFMRLLQSIGKGGYFFLGNSENLPQRMKGAFRTVDEKSRIFQKTH